ncbi:MAG: hypothetical protein ACTSSK_13610, partial [Candidatus Heimdallarchaeota archaeon]
SKIEFGKWINDLTPDYVYEAILEFLIIREAMAHFLTDEVLFGELSSLTNLILNIVSMSFYQEMHKTKTLNIKLSLFRTRLLTQEANSSNFVEIYNKITPLIDSVLKSNVSYILIIKSYLYIIEDIDEIDEDEILQAITRYLAKTSEELIFPIYLKENQKKILYHLSQLGYDSTLNEIASLVGVDESIISKELKKLDSRFKANWFVEKNWLKLGLHVYLLIIRFDHSLRNNRAKMLDYLNTNSYFYDIYTGENEGFTYVYSVFQSSHFISERLASRLEKFQKEKSITSFDLKSITSRNFSTTVLNEPSTPTEDFYKKLITGKVPHEKIMLWSSDRFDDKNPESLESKDYVLLKFLSFVKNKSITSYDVFGVFLTGFNDFLEENGVDPNDMVKSVAFFKQNENLAKKRKLTDYRLVITLTDLAIEGSLVVRIKLNPEEKISQEILNKLLIFNFEIILNSYNDFFIIIGGLKFDHFVTKLIKDLLAKYDVDYEIFSIKNAIYKNIPYYNLYDFNSKKWALTELI